MMAGTSLAWLRTSACRFERAKPRPPSSLRPTLMSRSRNGGCQRPVRTRTILLQRATERIRHTGQMANLLGRLGPKTGQFFDNRLNTFSASGPHGLVSDANGAIWFTASFKGYIGKLDPVTGDVREFRLPDPTAQGPHTRVFDRKGILWITVIGGNMIGVSRSVKRRDQARFVAYLQLSALRLAGETPRARRSSPSLVRTRFAAWILETMRIEEYVLPNVEARPRRIAAMSDDLIWYSDYPIGYLGGLDPRPAR